MALTRDHFIKSVSNDVGINKRRSTILVESFMEIIKKTLENGEDVMISGFGKFCVKDKTERRGRNPHTGNDMMLGARRVVVFKCSPVLREKINGAEQETS